MGETTEADLGPPGPRQGLRPPYAAFHRSSPRCPCPLVISVAGPGTGGSFKVLLTEAGANMQGPEPRVSRAVTHSPPPAVVSLPVERARARAGP